MPLVNNNSDFYYCNATIPQRSMQSWLQRETSSTDENFLIFLLIFLPLGEKMSRRKFSARGHAAIAVIPEKDSSKQNPPSVVIFIVRTISHQRELAVKWHTDTRTTGSYCSINPKWERITLLEQDIFLSLRAEAKRRCDVRKGLSKSPTMVLFILSLRAICNPSLPSPIESSPILVSEPASSNFY